VREVAELPLPGSGRTLERFERLAAIARHDPVLARLAEGHADAAAIRAELGDAGPGHPDERWGVWAAKPTSVTARPDGDAWTLTGERPWCSGAGSCTHALVTAAAPDGVRLFAVENRAPWATPLDGTWPAVGMAGSDSRTVRFADAPARPVGGPGAYVGRPGFWHGGVGVAACWYGGATGIADTLLDRAHGPHALAHLGAVDVLLSAARAVLHDAARRIDADPAAGAEQLAVRVRCTVESAAAQVIDRVGRALGAGPLGHDGAHAHRVADLTVYLRQSHAEADLAHLGELLKEDPPAW
jgi:alkylation response protein AidB-like acyl-CoA dehydrogenase